MQILNKTRGTVLAQDAVIANSFLAKNIGLLAYNTPKAMIINTRWGIHTFGMRYPIDVLVLDKENKVVKIKQSLHPNRIFIWNPIYHRIIELPEGCITQTKTSLKNIINTI